MNYIWEIMLQADYEKIKRQELMFIQATNPNPYLEVSLQDLNDITIRDKKIEINPLYRFANIFLYLCDVNLSGLEKTRSIYFDICFHYLAQLDLRAAMDKLDYYICFVNYDIKKNLFGYNIKESADLFTNKESLVWRRHLLHLYQSANYRKEFNIVVRTIYECAIIYERNDENNEVLVYIGTKKTDTEIKKIKFLIDLFLPMQDRVYIYYENHFGIIGIEETMLIDEVVLF